MNWITGIIIWVICGILAYGVSLAWTHKEYPYIAEKLYKFNIKVSVMVGLYGPIGLISVLIHSKGGLKHGLKFW